MIYLFRRIRQSLVEGNRFRKYLLYAIGEIALVMIGILLALQVNNWNEHRKNTINKNAYCAQLINSLQADLGELERYSGRVNIVQSSCQYVWDYLNGTITDIDTNLFKMNFLNAPNVFEFTPNPTVYNNLVESVGLSSIKSDSLKSAFGIYFSSDQGTSQSRQQRVDYAAAYSDIRFEFCSPMMLKDYLHQLFSQTEVKTNNLSLHEISSVEITGKIPDLTAYEMDWKKMKQSTELKTLLGRMMAIREPLFNQIDKSDYRIKLMIDLLKKEIH